MKNENGYSVSLKEKNELFLPFKAGCSAVR